MRACAPRTYCIGHADRSLFSAYLNFCDEQPLSARGDLLSAKIRLSKFVAGLSVALWESCSFSTPSHFRCNSLLGTYACVSGLPMSTGSIPNRASELTIMIRLASAAAIAALVSTAAIAQSSNAPMTHPMTQPALKAPPDGPICSQSVGPVGGPPHGGDAGKQYDRDQLLQPECV
jgi:hypothetical protein